MKQQQTDNTQDKQVSSHTPGEWKVGKIYTSRYKEYLPILYIGLSGHATIAIIQPFEDKITNEDKANAELIAQAPTLKAENEKLKADKAVLLEALNACKPYINDLQSENYNEPNNGIFYDTKLENAFNLIDKALNK